MNELAELLPGRTYVLETDLCLSAKVKQRLLENLKWETERLKCKFLILDGGIKLVKNPVKALLVSELSDKEIELIKLAKVDKSLLDLSKEDLLTLVLALRQQRDFANHNKDCNYWSWDWNYSWHTSDCTCQE